MYDLYFMIAKGECFLFILSSNIFLNYATNDIMWAIMFIAGVYNLWFWGQMWLLGSFAAALPCFDQN